jgi:PAS domain S-box-containing protein
VGVESRQQLHGLVESAMDAIITVDDSLRIVLFNSAACVMFGVAAEQVMGTDVERFLPARFRHVHSQQVRSFSEQGRTARSMGKLGYVMALRANGEEFPAEASISHVEIEGKKHYTAIMRDITARKQAQEALESSLLEKEALLKEVHHRVKNNLQVISSLLRLEAGRSAQPDTKSVLVDMQGRIRSMALLHEMLYRSGNFAAVDLGVFVKQLANQVFRMQTSQQGSVRLLLELDSVRVGMDQATPCGLLVNELISNSLKHGFPEGRSGVVRVALRAVVGGEAAVGGSADGRSWRLSVSDDGVGLPDDFVPNSGQSLGLLLVEDLARQLRGRLQIERHNNNSGVTFAVTFRLDALDLPPADV